MTDPDIWEAYADQKKASQEKRARNRESSPKILESRGIKFTSNNEGAHLIVECGTGFIDFWPGTGKWIPRDTAKAGRGVDNLVKYIKVHC